MRHKTSSVRYQVTYAEAGNLVLLRPSGAPLGLVSAAEFERVDGPHPADEGPEPAPLHVGADNGPPAQLCSTPACSASGVAATTLAGMCVYCTHRNALDGYSRGGLDARPENVAARKKLAAWELAGKPRRVNSAERKSLAAGHPRTWPSAGDDEP